MKRKTIENFLNQYDSNKGYGRTLIKEEPHIKELRTFFNELEDNDNDLPPQALKKLATILIGKNNRTDTTESGRTFEKLAKRLGGYAALDALNEANQLTARNVAFLEKHPKKAPILVPLIVSIAKKTTPAQKSFLFTTAQQMKAPENMPELFKQFDKLSGSENFALYFSILEMGKQYDFNVDEIIPVLCETKDIAKVKQVLTSMEEKNKELITFPNLIKVLSLQCPFRFNSLFLILKQDQKTLDSLFEIESTLDSCLWYEDIIINFNDAGWNVTPYLNAIFKVNKHGLTLTSATDKLKKIPVKAEFLPFILETICARPAESMELVAAVEILSKDGLDEESLKTAFAARLFPDRVATAIVLLKREECYTAKNQECVCKYPESAPGLAHLIIQLKKAKCHNPTPLIAIQKHPHCAEATTKVIAFFQEHYFHGDKNVIAACSAEISDDTFLELLKLLKKRELLDVSNLNKLFPRMGLIKTLTTGVKCLAYGGKLDQLNLDTLITDPINAVSLAENLGGKPSPFKKAPQDKGAKDFIEIRKNSRVLWERHQKHLFFPKMPPEKVKTYEEATRMRMADVENAVLIKIASYTGDHALEENAELNIASSYFSKP